MTLLDPATIYSLLGPFAVLLAVERSKKPARTGWQNIRLGDTWRDEYRDELLSAASIGVLLGEPSSGVVTLDLDDDSWTERFLSLNPLWRHTLRTKGARGCQIWMRMRPGCWYPQSIKRLKTRDGTHVGEWRGGGGQSIICGEHPSGVRYQVLVERPAVEIGFGQIRWPYQFLLPWEETRKERKPTHAESLVNLDDEVLAKRISHYLAAIPAAVSGNGGHDQTYSVAMALVNGWGLPRGQAMCYLQFYNQRCEPPWSQKELDHKIDDAIKNEDKTTKGHLRTERRIGDELGNDQPSVGR